MNPSNSVAKQKAVLVSIATDTAEIDACERSLAELSRLLDTAGGETFATVIQTKDHFDPKTCIGSGKCLEIKQLCHDNQIHLAIFDFELSPSQIRNLEEVFEDVEVIDRSMLILDIFAMHAQSAEGKLQVEVAQLKYTAPRLVGKGKELSRQEGRIGTRGPGESKLETDRRHLKSRLYALEQALDELEQKRKVMRSARDRSEMVKIAIVGYTNAGKSTLLNAMTDAGVLSEDKLFATLDATTRRLILENGEPVLLTDTVGLIRKLPHHLIKAFRSTLDEVRYADMIMVVADASDPEVDEHIAVTESILSDLDAQDKPTLYAYNKCDLIRGDWPTSSREDTVFFSATTGQGIDRLSSALCRMVSEQKKRVTLYFPYTEQSKVSALYQQCQVESVEYLEDSVKVVAVLSKKHLGRYTDYVR